MTSHTLRLLEDRIQPGAPSAYSHPAENRVIYVVEGEVAITHGTAPRRISANNAWCGADACTVRGDARGARLWRWELVRFPVQTDGMPRHDAVVTTHKLAREVSLDPDREYLVRCDRVDFPPGGIAYTHTHAGPGIRCLVRGALTVHVNDRQTLLAPGEAWFESGLEPVYAAASASEPTGFVRVMILPRTLAGKSSIRYVNPGDQDKPKPQKYSIFLDEPIQL